MQSFCSLEGSQVLQCWMQWLHWQLHIFINRPTVHRRIVLCNQLCQFVLFNPLLVQSCASELFQTETNKPKTCHGGRILITHHDSGTTLKFMSNLVFFYNLLTVTVEVQYVSVVGLYRYYLQDAGTPESGFPVSSKQECFLQPRKCSLTK